MPLNYDLNTYLTVTLSDRCDPSTLQTVHPAVTYIDQVGQLTDVHRISIPVQDWEQGKEDIMQSLTRAGIVRIDVERLQQRAKRSDDHEEL